MYCSKLYDTIWKPMCLNISSFTIWTQLYHMTNGNWCKPKDQLIELKHFHPKILREQDHIRSLLSRQMERYNAPYNTLYQPQQVYKQIQDEKLNEFNFSMYHIPMCTSEWNKVMKTKMNTITHASRFTQVYRFPKMTLANVDTRINSKLILCVHN